VAAGVLGWYGVSSNTVAHPVDDPEATSLARMLTTHVVSALDQGIKGELARRWRAWRDRCVPELDRMLDAFRAEAGLRSQEQSRAITAAVDPHLPPGRRGASLSQKPVYWFQQRAPIRTIMRSLPEVRTPRPGARRSGAEPADRG
jgi:hypothetical protein